MEQVSLEDLMIEVEKVKRQGVPIVKLICQQLNNKGIDAWPLKDSCWGIGIKLGDAVLKTELLQFTDKKNYSEQIKEIPSYTVKVGMDIMEQLCQTCIGPQKAAEHLSEAFKQQLLIQFKKYKEAK